MTVNYNALIYKSGLCDLDNLKEFKRISKEFKQIIEYFETKTTVDEKFINMIIFSYKYYDKKIMIKNRINLIRGIAYSRHYIDISDIDSFLELLHINDTYHDLVNITMWSKIELDEDYLVSMSDLMSSDNDLIYSANKIQERMHMNELFKEAGTDGIISYDNSTTTDELDNDEDDDLDEDDEYRSEMTITPEDKLVYFDLQFNNYKKEIYKAKELKDKKEIKYISIGMDIWFKFIMGELKTIYDINKKQRLRDPKNLHLSI